MVYCQMCLRQVIRSNGYTRSNNLPIFGTGAKPTDGDASEFAHAHASCPNQGARDDGGLGRCLR